MEEGEEEVYWVLGAWCEEVSEQVLILEEEEVSGQVLVLEEAWRTVGYLEEAQLTQLSSTENNLLIHALLGWPSNLLLSYSNSPFSNHHKNSK